MSSTSIEKYILGTFKISVITFCDEIFLSFYKTAISNTFNRALSNRDHILHN